MIESNSVKNKVRVIPLALGLIGLVVFGCASHKCGKILTQVK